MANNWQINDFKILYYFMKKKQNLTAFYKLLVLDELWAVEDGTSSKFKNCQK